MRLEGQRESQNVERRRGGSGKKAAMGGGLGAIIIAIFAMKQPASQVIAQLAQNQGQQQGTAKPLTPAQERMDQFVRQIKGSTEEVWTKLFRQAGQEYRIPKLVNYDGMTRMKTGGGGDFAYAYVIAHEVGHHIQKLTGKTTYVHQQRRSLSNAQYNQL